MCGELVGIDVSGRAMERARARCPKAWFLASDNFTPALGGRPPFDLEVASQVLNYVKDVPAELERLSQLGRARRVTYSRTPGRGARPLRALDPGHRVHGRPLRRLPVDRRVVA